MNEHTNTLKFDLQTFAEPEPQNEPAPPAPATQEESGEHPKPDTPQPASLVEQAAGLAQEAGTVNYDFTGSLPEGYELDENTSNAFGDICRGMNLNNDQANQLAAYGFKW